MACVTSFLPKHGDIFTVLAFNGRVLHTTLLKPLKIFAQTIALVQEDTEVFIKLHYQLVRWLL
ncbi:hypothetical protein Gotur_026738 [Gossypium turneri]